MKSKSDLRNDVVTLKHKLEAAEHELGKFNNPKNWTRSYNCNGDLINESALYIPKLPNGKI